VTLLLFLLFQIAAPVDSDAAIFQLVADQQGPDLLIADRTLPLCGPPPCLGDRDVVAALKRAAGERFAAFEERNRQAMRIAPLRGRVQMASPETIARIMDEGGWDELHCAYPQAKAVVYFSSPAYASDDAVLYFEEACDWGCGSGWYLRFTRDGNRWKIVERVDLWMSTP
jgi:hypothetical protein